MEDSYNALPKTNNKCIAPDGMFICKIIFVTLVFINCIFFMSLPLVYCGTGEPLTSEEKEWLKQHDGKIIVNNESGWPPIIDRDNTGNSFGIVMDYQRLIEKKLNFKFKLDKPDTWDNFMERFQKREIDVNNNLQKNPKREEYALFTKPYIEIPNVIIVRKEIKSTFTLEKMAEMKIAATKDFAIYDYIKTNYNQLQLIPFDSDIRCLLETSTKQVDAAVVNLAVASFLIEKMGISNLRVAGYADYKNSLCFATRKDWPILNQILNKGLDLITQEEKDEIYRKWISLGDMPFYKSRSFWVVSSSIASIVFTVFLMVLIWNRSLKRLVEQRTVTLGKQTEDLEKEITDRKLAEEALQDKNEEYEALNEELRSSVEELQEATEELQAQNEELQQAEAELRFQSEIMTNIAEAIYLVRMDDGVIVYTNSTFKKMFGYEQDEMLGKHVSIVNAPSEKKPEETAKEIMAEINHTGSWKGDVNNIKKDGTTFWCYATVSVFDHSKYGKVLVAIHTGITERKFMEEALRESEEKHKRMIANISDVIAIMDKDGTLKYKSPNIEKWFGWQPEDLAGTDGWETVHPGDLERIQKEFFTLLDKDNSVTTVEYRYKCKDGSYKWIALTAVNLTNDPIISGVLMNYRDITERKQAEEALIKQNGLFNSLLNNLPIGVYMIEVPSGKPLLANEASFQLLGREILPEANADTITKTYDLYKSDSNTPYPNEELPLVVAMGGVSKHVNDMDVVKPDGTRIALEVFGSPVRDEKGNIWAGLVSFIDITERKQNRAERDKLQAQLNQTQKMESIGNLAGGIAHDFNNILYPIIGHAEMLLDDIPEGGSIRDSLNQIYSSSLRARDLVQQILAFARQEKSELKLMKMQPIIKEAMKLIRSTIPATIAITQNIQSDCRPVSADPTKIHQIVMNLVTNAYHAMEKNGGELKVNLKEIELGENDLINPDMSPGLYACLSIADTGTGINKAVMNRIFDPFFTTKEKGKGTGMGLSVVHGIVKRMKGEIQVYSEPDKGTEFHVYLPIVGNASEKQEPKADEPLPGGSERLLLVDDEHAIIAIGERILERLGYQVTSRPGSLEALEAFKANPDKFDLVITDMSMPKMSGDKLAVELIRIRPDIPILLCTGFSENMTDEKIKSMGIKGFLMKPFMIKEFAQTIREVLDHETIDKCKGNYGNSVNEFMQALLSLDRLAAKQILKLQAQTISPVKCVEDVVVVSLERIGAGWQDGTVALSQVYMAGRICEDLVDEMLPPGDPDRKNQPRMAICVLNDHHKLGKIIVYSVLRASGFDLSDYGVMEVDALVKQVQKDKIELLLISVLMLPSALKVKTVKEKLNALGLDIKIIVGGAPFRFDDQLWKAVDADAMCQNASEAIAVIENIMGGRI